MAVALPVGEPSGRRARRLLLAVLALAAVIALPILTYPLGRDQGEFATIGRGILDGRAPYVDLWNPKPPAVFYVYALAMAVFGRTTEALRALDLLIAPAISVTLFALGRRLAGPRVGLWAALLFPVFYFTETFWTLTQNDGIALLPMTLAVYCAVRAAESRTKGWRWALACGLLGGWTLWFKYPFALFVAAVAGIYLLLRPRQAGLWQPVGAFIAGGLVVGLGGLALMAAQGALDALLESAAVTSQYTALGFNLTDFGAALATYFGFRWSHWGLLFVLSLAWPLLWTARGPSGNRRLWAGVWLWLLAGLGIMLAQAKGYDYHWLPMLPPLVLLGAGSLERVIQLSAGDRAGRAVRLLAAAGLLAIMAAGIWPITLPYLTGQEDQAAYYGRFQAGEFVADESLLVARYLRERIAPGDSLFIWGFRPEVYYLSQLNPAIRFIFQFPLVGAWYPPEWKEEAVEVLWAAMPPYVLVLQVDYMPWVTGRHEDSNQLLQEYTELNNWLIANYSRETQIGNFFLWRRNS